MKKCVFVLERHLDKTVQFLGLEGEKKEKKRKAACCNFRGDLHSVGVAMNFIEGLRDNQQTSRRTNTHKIMNVIIAIIGGPPRIINEIENVSVPVDRMAKFTCHVENLEDKFKVLFIKITFICHIHVH